MADPRQSRQSPLGCQTMYQRWCLNGKFSGCLIGIYFQQEAAKQGSSTKEYELFVVLSNFPEPFFYLCGENYVCDTDESLLHKNSFFERARLLFSISAIEKQPTSLQNYQKNLKMHLNLVKIRKPVVTQFFWAKDFCNRLLQKTFAIDFCKRLLQQTFAKDFCKTT